MCLVFIVCDSHGLLLARKFLEELRRYGTYNLVSPQNLLPAYHQLPGIYLLLFWKTSIWYSKHFENWMVNISAAGVQSVLRTLSTAWYQDKSRREEVLRTWHITSRSHIPTRIPRFILLLLANSDIINCHRWYYKIIKRLLMSPVSIVDPLQ